MNAFLKRYSMRIWYFIFAINISNNIAFDAPSTRQSFFKEGLNKVIISLATLNLAPKVAIAAFDIKEDEHNEAYVREAISSFLSGAVVSTSKTLILHPVDTVKTRMQVKESSFNLVQNLYRGVLPPLLIGAPSGALFFSVKDLSKEIIQAKIFPNSVQWSTSLAVLIAQFPYWLIRTPTEILKNQSQVKDISWNKNMLRILSEKGIGGFYEGYGANIIYAYPVDVIKFVLYDELKNKSSKRHKLSSIDAAVLGALASAVSQLLTTPFDVARTRIMIQSNYDDDGYVSTFDALKKIVEEEGVTCLWKGSIPRIIRSLLSGAIQFSSYEISKKNFLKS